MGNRNRLVNYVRSHRKRAGLSQRELALILGYRNEGVISRHELFRSVPPLLMALGYEAVFGESVSDLFPGLKETVEDAIEQSLVKFESALLKQKDQVKGSSQLSLITRKLEWLNERREISGKR